MGFVRQGQGQFRIPRQYSHFVFSVIQSGINVPWPRPACLSFYLQGTLAAHWRRAYLLSWAIMLPVVVLVAAPAGWR